MLTRYATSKATIEYEWLHIPTGKTGSDERTLEDIPEEDDETWARICGWVKFGYARAHRRFKGESYIAYSLFRSIEEEFKSYFETLKQYADTGMEFSIALDYENGHASMNYSPWL